MTVHASNEVSAALTSPSCLALPPLILHPFSDSSGPRKLVESSRANLILQGLLPAGDSTRDDLDLTLLEGRFLEMRMIYYVGKDLVRWIEQCLDTIRRHPGNSSAVIRAQSFAGLLLQDTPAAIVDKLTQWGVTDFKAIFRRGIGLNMLFRAAPERDTLSDEFIRNYYRYADQLFSTYQTQTAYPQLKPECYRFDLYSSGEYSRMLERQWS